MDATERRVVGKAAIMEIVDRGQIVGGGQIVGRVSIQEMVFLKSDMTALAAGVFSGFKSSEKVYAHNFGYRPLVAGVCRQREDATSDWYCFPSSHAVPAGDQIGVQWGGYIRVTATEVRVLVQDCRDLPANAGDEYMRVKLSVFKDSVDEL